MCELWRIKGAERLAGTHRGWGFAFEGALRLLNFVLCLSPRETNRTTQLTSKQVSNSLDLCGLSFVSRHSSRQFQGIRAARQERQERREKGRGNTNVTLTLLLSVKHQEQTLGGSGLSYPVNYSQQLFFSVHAGRLTV